MQQRTYNQVVQRQFVPLRIPVLIGVPRWQTYSTDFCNVRLVADDEARILEDEWEASRTVLNETVKELQTRYWLLSETLQTGTEIW